VTSKNPVGKLAETAISTLKNPIGAAGKVVDQAKGTVALGKVVAETAGSVVVRAAGRKPRQETYQSPASSPADLRPVPDVNEPAGTQPPGTQERGTEDSPKKHGDPLAYKREADLVDGATGRATKKTPAAKPAAKKTATKRASTGPTAKKTTAKRQAPSPKTTTGKAPTKQVSATPADVAEVVEAAVAENPTKTAAKPAKKAPAKKSPAKKATPGGKLPAKKTQPKSAEQVLADDGTDVRTPSGIPAADSAHNPDTADVALTQPGTEPLVDPGAAKATRSETETLRKAAEKNPE
jgi:hypothetical protein